MRDSIFAELICYVTKEEIGPRLQPILARMGKETWPTAIELLAWLRSQRRLHHEYNLRFDLNDPRYLRICRALEASPELAEFLEARSDGIAFRDDIASSTRESIEQYVFDNYAPAFSETIRKAE